MVATQPQVFGHNDVILDVDGRFFFHEVVFCALSSFVYLACVVSLTIWLYIGGCADHP